MSATDEALYCGGARPKTNVGSVKKEKRNDHDQRKDIKPKKIQVCDEGFFENMNHGKANGTRQLQSANNDVNCSRDDVKIVKPRWNKSYHDAVPPSSSIFNYNCEVDPDLSINSINLFRTKQPSLKPIPVGNRFSEDNLMTGSLHNLSLDTDGDTSGLSSETHPKYCSNGASDLLCDELNNSLTRDILSPQSSTKESSCGSCKLDDPEALAKWRTAGLALRHLLSKKSCQETNRPNQSSPSHKLHHKAGRTSCWLERLKDFDEYEDEYFSCCTCDDTEDVTLTKTGSSSSLGSLDSEQLLKLPSEIREETFDSCGVHLKVTDNKEKEIGISPISTIKAQEDSDIPDLSISSSCDPLLDNQIECNMGKFDVNDFDQNLLSSCTNSTPLTNSVCNSIVWEMLQKPYSLAVRDGPSDNSFSHLNENQTQSPKNCDIFQCNNSYSQKMLDISYTAPLSHLLPEISKSNSTSRICGDHISSVSQLNNDESAQITDGSVKPSLLDNIETNTLNIIPDACVSNNEISKSIMSKRPTDIAITKNNLSNFHTSYSKDGLNARKQSSPEHKQLNSAYSSLLTKSPLNVTQPTTASYTYNSCWYGENFIPSYNTEMKSSDSNFESVGGSQNPICSLGNFFSVQEAFPQSKPEQASNACVSTNNPSSSKPIETESEVTDCSSVYADTSGEIFFSEGTDSSDLPSKFLRLNPTKNSTEYYARHTGKEKKKKVLHARKTLRRSGSTSSDVEDGDKANEKKGSGCLEFNDDNLCGVSGYKPINSSMLSDLLHPSTPLARFLKSHTSNPHDNQSASMPWENIEDGLSVESCADGDSVAGFSDGSTLQRKNSWTHNGNSASDKDSHFLNTEGIDEKGSSQDRPSTALRKLLNMEMNTELKGDNSQYSPETWVRLVDQISLPFECAEEDGNEMTNDAALVDSTEKSNEFTDLCLPNYESSTSCDADDEFECDCEHCQLLKNMGNTDDIPVTGDGSVSAASGQNPTTYTWPDFLEDDTSLDLDLSELRPLEPLLMNLQDIPQDLIDIMFQTVIMQMLTVHPELMGDEASPPVPQDVIESLPIIITTQIHIDQEVSCPICLCPCQLNESLTRLCCQHLYHPLCIQAWLAKSGTCPVCRSAVNGSSNDDVT